MLIFHIEKKSYFQVIHWEKKKHNILIQLNHNEKQKT